MKLRSSPVVCLLPKKKSFWRATAQLITDMESYCRDLGFHVRYSKSRLSLIFQLVLVLGRYKIIVIPYPGLFSPIVKSLTNFIVGLLIGLELLLLRLLGKKIVFYVYDLPIEQNIFILGKITNEQLSRIIESMFLRVVSLLLVFNTLSSRYLTTRYRLDIHKFEYFEILDYGSNINIVPSRKRDILSNKIKVVYAANFGNPKAREKITLFLSNCTERANIDFLLVGRDSHLIELKKPNVKKLGEVEQGLLSLILNQSNFGLIIKASQYYEFTSTSKFSSYLHMGLPVLVPQDYVYLSNIIEKYGVGIIFKDCQDLVEKLTSLSSTDYSSLVTNAETLGHKVRNGYFFKKAMLKALKKMITKQ